MALDQSLRAHFEQCLAHRRFADAEHLRQSDFREMVAEFELALDDRLADRVLGKLVKRLRAAQLFHSRLSKASVEYEV